MKIQILSDLHIEFEKYEYHDIGADVVILAGDIDVKGKGVDWAMQNIVNKPVLYIPGNHELYRKAYPKLVDDMKSRTQGSHVVVLDKDTFIIDKVRFLGCMLWTNFELFGNPKIAGIEAMSRMTDYKLIRQSPSYNRMRSIDTAVIHRASLTWLQQELEMDNGYTNIVITHHAPSPESLPDRARQDIISAAYASDLGTFIEQHDIKLWVHGHIHQACDYQLAGARIICNPRGYPDEQDNGFDPDLMLEI